MPIYEYRCDNDHTFEAFQSMADHALDACEVCGAPARRVLSAPAVHFKGSGFYTTDYARKGKKGGAASDGTGESKSESKSESSSGSSDSGGDSKKGEGKSSSSAKAD